MIDDRPPIARRRHVAELVLVGAALAFGVSPALALTIGAAATIWRTSRVLRARSHARALANAQDRKSIELGVSPNGRTVRIPEAALRAHGLILGATGAGKTTTMLKILEQEIERGHSVVAIDLKGSPHFADQLRAMAQQHSRDFKLWTPDGPTAWNPLAVGNPTECKDKLIATERFTEPHYQRAAERYLQQALTVHAQTSPNPPTLSGVVKLLDPSELATRARSLPPDRAANLGAYVSSLTRDQLSAIRGLQSRLALLTESHTGQFLAPAADREQLNLRDSMNRGDVVLFSISGSTYGSSAAQLGSLVVQDLVTATGSRLQTMAAMGSSRATPEQDLSRSTARETQSRPVIVAIDEFSVLGAGNVVSLLARGREAGVGVLLATQELADLDRAARGLRDQVLGNTAVKIAHRQDVPESAQTVARIAGTEKAWERTYRESPGMFGSRGAQGATVRAVDRLRVEPGQISELRPGEAVVVVKSPQASATLARIDRPGSVRSERRSPTQRLIGHIKNRGDDLGR